MIRSHLAQGNSRETLTAVARELGDELAFLFESNGDVPEAEEVATTLAVASASKEEADQLATTESGDLQSTSTETCKSKTCLGCKRVAGVDRSFLSNFSYN